MLIQIIGWLGMASFLASYQLKSNKGLFLLQMLGAFLFCVQFCLLGAYSGCFSLAAILLRCIMLTNYKKYAWIRWKGWIFIFSAYFLAVMILTWNGPVSILAFIASVVSTVFYWTNNPWKIRACNLFCASPCWLAYDLIVGSFGGAANEGFAMISIIISIVRFGWRNLFHEENE